MPTLHIEHAISDFTVWSAAFERFAPVRKQYGVLAERVLRPVDDPAYVFIDLDFETVEAAETFAQFLRTTVWSTPDNSPALVGSPQARVLLAA